MKLPKNTRQKLYEAQGKPVSIEWPSDAPDPHGGKRYAVYSEEDGSKLFSIRLERSKRHSRGTRALIRIDEDPVRILPGLAGVRAEDGSYETEPERVDERYEELLAAEALQKTTLLSAEQRQREKGRRKEHRNGTSPRTERAVKRHQKALERSLRAS